MFCFSLNAFTFALHIIYLLYFIFTNLFSFHFLLTAGVGKYDGQRKTNPPSSKMQMRYSHEFFCD